jgi:hypothetical protein
MSAIAGLVFRAARDLALNVVGALFMFSVTGLLGALVRSGIEKLLKWGWTWPALGFALAAGVAWAAIFGLVRKDHVVNPEGKILPLPVMAFLLGCAFVWVYVFAGLSYALMRLGAIEYTVAQRPEDLLAFLTDAYLWHFLDLVPGLKIPDALGWKCPVDLQGGVRGVLLVLFRVAVIYQVFAKASQILKEDKPSPAGSAASA